VTLGYLALVGGGASTEVWSGNFSRMGLHTSANSIASRITSSETRIQRFRVMSTKLTKARNNCIIKKIDFSDLNSIETSTASSIIDKWMISNYFIGSYARN